MFLGLLRLFVHVRTLQRHILAIQFALSKDGWALYKKTSKTLSFCCGPSKLGLAFALDAICRMTRQREGEFERERERARKRKRERERAREILNLLNWGNVR